MKHEFLAPETPQQNGVAERKNKTLLNMATTIFSRKNIIYFGKMIGEEAVPIEQTKGDIVIPIINKKQINDRIKQNE